MSILTISIDKNNGQRWTKKRILWRATFQFKQLNALVASTSITASVEESENIDLMHVQPPHYQHPAQHTTEEIQQPPKYPS